MASWRLLVAAGLIAVLAGGSAAAGSPVGQQARPGHSPRKMLELARSLTFSYLTIGEGLVDAVAGPPAIDYGADGRLTVLLVGSDWRERLRGYGERMDTIMVMTIDPQTRQIAALSIPRDVARIPLPEGGTYNGRINGIFKYYKKQFGTREEALRRFESVVARLLAIEIDYHAYIRFTGFDRLVDEVGGVAVEIQTEIRDPKITDDPDRPRGALFRASPNAVLRGQRAPRCQTTKPPINWSRVPNCTHALPYVRSRKGPHNSDWVRARRQQGFVMAAVRRVLALNPTQTSTVPLFGLRDAAQSVPEDVYTDMPVDDDRFLLDLLLLLRGSDSRPMLQAVLKPPTYAHHVPGTHVYELEIEAVLGLTAEWFAPVR